RRVCHELGFGFGRQPALAPIDTECTQHLATRGLDRRRPGGAKPGVERHLTALLPERVLRNVSDEHLPAEIDGGGARTVTDIDTRAFEHGPQALWQPRRNHV